MYIAEQDGISISDLEKLSAISEYFLQIIDEDLDYQRICDDMHEISGAKYTIFNLYNVDGKNYSTVAMSGDQMKIKKASSLIGFKFVGKKREQNSLIINKIKDKNITMFASLTELAGDSIPKVMIATVEKAFNIGTCYFVKIVKNNVLLGDFQLLMEKNQTFQRDVIVEIYSRQLGLFINQRRAEEALRKSRDYMENLLKYINAPIIVWDTNFFITIFNRAFERVSGRSFEEVVGKSVDILLPAEKKKDFFELIKSTSVPGRGDTFEIEIQHKDGSIRTLILNSATLYSKDGKRIESTIAQGEDITRRKKAEQEVVFLSYHDHLTGLYNRRFYEEELRRLDTKRNLPIVLVMADVNGLKLTNDAFGHKLGDQLLVRIAEILKQECRSDEILARIGGDEFVMLLPKTTAEEAKKFINRISNAIDKKKGDAIVLSISMGFAVKELMTEEMDDIFKKAEDDMYRHKLSEGSSMRSKTIDLIMNSLFEKNDRELHHSKRVSEICEAIATKMDFAKFEVDQIKTAGLMHDIGKIGIGDNILNKEGSLTYEEWQEIKRHSEVGYRILSSANEFSEIANYVLEHQERWDGKGYPKGLKGEEITIEARIIAVADAYDAMTSDRSYRKKLSEEEAILQMKRFAGSQFDPEIVSVLIDKVLKQSPL